MSARRRHIESGPGVPEPESGVAVAPHIFSVSELTSRIRRLLEDKFAFVWLDGEISNFSRPASGHFYFTLKDARSQIRAVMFKGQNRRLGFLPCNGMQVIGIGRLSVYEPRGEYQVIFEYLEPKGVGALQVAFEALKEKLRAEGLFEQSGKKPLPFLPRHICLMTSQTGRVVHDLLRIIDQRYDNMRVSVYPIPVQGEAAAGAVADALRAVNAAAAADVIILARGGGSLEDLQAFNTEIVARAISTSSIPVVSAIGHETDYTISDFVADSRAATPSAAAALIVPRKADMAAKLMQIRGNIVYITENKIKTLKHQLERNASRLGDPRRQLDLRRMRLDELESRAVRSLGAAVRESRTRMERVEDRLQRQSPRAQLDNLTNKINMLYYRSANSTTSALSGCTSRWRALQAHLQALDPKAVLSRGYSITRLAPEGAVVTNASQVQAGRRVDILLHRGRLGARIEAVEDVEMINDAGDARKTGGGESAEFVDDAKSADDAAAATGIEGVEGADDVEDGDVGE